MVARNISFSLSHHHLDVNIACGKCRGCFLCYFECDASLCYFEA